MVRLGCCNSQGQVHRLFVALRNMCGFLNLSTFPACCGVLAPALLPVLGRRVATRLDLLLVVL
jgi:hypothetical protein